MLAWLDCSPSQLKSKLEEFIAAEDEASVGEAVLSVTMAVQNGEWLRLYERQQKLSKRSTRLTLADILWAVGLFANTALLRYKIAGTVYDGKSLPLLRILRPESRDLDRLGRHTYVCVP